MYCAECGAEVPESAKFCSKCGAVMGMAAADRDEGVRGAGSAGLPKAVLALAAAVVAIAATGAVVGFALLRDGDGGGPDGTPTPSVTVMAGENVPVDRWAMGYADAPVEIYVFSDFQCPFCRRAGLEVVPQLKTKYLATGKAKLIFKNMAFLGDESRWAAEAAACAADENRFWDYHDKLFEEQKGENKGAFRVENLKRFAREIGLDGAAFDACFDEGKYEGQIAADLDEAANRGVNATPTFFVDQTEVASDSYGAIADAIDQALEEEGIPSTRHIGG